MFLKGHFSFAGNSLANLTNLAETGYVAVDAWPVETASNPVYRLPNFHVHSSYLCQSGILLLHHGQSCPADFFVVFAC